MTSTITAVEPRTVEPGSAREHIVTSRAARTWASRASLLVFVVAIGYLVVLPLYRLQRLALDDGAQGYSTAFEAPNIGKVIRTTVELGFGAMALAMVLGTTLAIAAQRLGRRVRFLQVVPILPIVLPPIATVAGWSFLLSPSVGYANTALRNLPWWSDLRDGPIDVYTVPWIIIITGIGLSSFVYLFVTAGLRNLNSELVEAARSSGASEITVLFRVTLPLLRPVLIYAAGVVLLLGLGQFTGPLLLGRQNGVDVLSTEMLKRMSTSPVDYAAAAAIGSPLIVFGLFVIFLQKILLGDESRFVTHGGKSFRPPDRRSTFSALFVLAYGAVAIALPMLSVLVVGLSKFWSGKIAPSEFTLETVRKVLDDDQVKSGIYNSVSCALVAVAIALPMGYLAATLILRGRRYRVFRTLVDIMVVLPLGVPAVIFGAGFLLTYTQGPLVLYGTRWVIILVYLTLMVPFTTRMQLSGMVALGDRYIEAARSSGAGVLRTHLQVMVPLLRPTLGGTAALMFVLLSHEFSASLLVRSSTTQVMGTVLYGYWSNGAYAPVAVMSLIMATVTTAGVVLAMLLGGRSVLEKL